MVKGMAQEVEYLPSKTSKCKVLSLSPSIAHKMNENKSGLWISQIRRVPRFQQQGANFKVTIETEDHSGSKRKG
jgi:hypothetical protein